MICVEFSTQIPKLYIRNNQLRVLTTMLFFSPDNSQVVAVETPSGRKKPWANPCLHPPNAGYALVGPALHQAYLRGEIGYKEWSRGWSPPVRFQTSTSSISAVSSNAEDASFKSPAASMVSTTPSDVWVPHNLKRKRSEGAATNRQLNSSFDAAAHEFGDLQLPEGYTTPPHPSEEPPKPLKKPKDELSADRKAAMVSSNLKLFYSRLCSNYLAVLSHRVFLNYLGKTLIYKPPALLLRPILMRSALMRIHFRCQ